MSIVLPRDDLWSPSGGIYAKSSQAWERAASIEMLHPDGTRGFLVDAGVRIHGYTSRMHDFTPKHSFRVVFKSPATARRSSTIRCSCPTRACGRSTRLC